MPRSTATGMMRWRRTRRRSTGLPQIGEIESPVPTAGLFAAGHSAGTRQSVGRPVPHALIRERSAHGGLFTCTYRCYFTLMRKVGIKTLKNDLSKYIRAA